MTTVPTPFSQDNNSDRQAPTHNRKNFPQTSSRSIGSTTYAVRTRFLKSAKQKSDVLTERASAGSERKLVCTSAVLMMSARERLSFAPGMVNFAAFCRNA